MIRTKVVPSWKNDLVGFIQPMFTYRDVNASDTASIRHGIAFDGVRRFLGDNLVFFGFADGRLDGEFGEREGTVPKCVHSVPVDMGKKQLVVSLLVDELRFLRDDVDLTQPFYASSSNVPGNHQKPRLNNHQNGNKQKARQTAIPI